MQILLEPVPHTEASEFIRSKPPVARAVFDQLVPELKARAFTVSGIESANVLQHLRDRIADLPLGGNWEEIKRSLAAEISPWLARSAGEGQEAMGDGLQAAERRAEMLLRWHGFQAYSAAQYEVMARQTDVFPYWRYESSEDGRVRPSHSALNGKILPANDPFWETHFPPWEYGCRCRIVPMTEEDVAEVQEREKDLPPEAQSVVPQDLRRQMNEGTLVTARRVREGQGRVTPPERIRVAPRAGGPAWRPGDLKLPAAELQKRYEPEVWRVFEAWAREVALPDGRTVWQWMEPGAPASSPSPRASRPAIASIAEAATAAAARTAIAGAVYSKRTPLGGGVNASEILETEAGERVVFKPAAGEKAGLRPDVPAGTYYKREVAASIVDEILGTGLVPPTAIVTHAGQVGSAQLFREGFETALRAARKGELPEPPKFRMELTKRQRQDWSLVDELLGHTDRHMGNWMIRRESSGEGWALALIDNGLCLGTSGKEYLRASPESGLKLDKKSRGRLESFLAGETDVRARLADLVEPPALDAMFSRARRMLSVGTFAKRLPDAPI